MAANEGSCAEYFASYADLQVHELMLKDRPRTVAYRRFFEENRKFVEGKVVMDVGAGSGILSLFAASAGARKVYAVEASGVAVLCQEIVSENNFDSVIEVIHDKVENVALPKGVQVDIIISEWMGFYLLHESMLDSVIYARDKFLSQGGILVPSTATLYVAPVDMSRHFDERAEYWSNLYGYDFSPMASSINMTEVSQPLIKCLDNDLIKSPAIKLLNLNLRTVTADQITSFCEIVEFPMSDDSRIHGFSFWFEVCFDVDIESSSDGKCTIISKDTIHNGTVSTVSLDSIDNSGDAKRVKQDNAAKESSPHKNLIEFSSTMPQNSFTADTNRVESKSKTQTKASAPCTPLICLSTGPSDPPTHWKQTTVFLPQTIMVTDGITLMCKVIMSQDVSNKRHYNITLELGDETGFVSESEEEEDSSIDGVDSDDSTGHPTPCFCGSNRCRLIAALIDKYDVEHQELEDEAENVETKAEVEAAKEIDAQIEHEGWPMDSSNVEGGDD